MLRGFACDANDELRLPPSSLQTNALWGAGDGSRQLGEICIRCVVAIAFAVALTDDAISGPAMASCLAASGGRSDTNLARPCVVDYVEQGRQMFPS